MSVFATGLCLPSHMEVTQDGRVLVSEFGAGNVRDVTDEHDFRQRDIGLYTQGFQHPSGILETSDARILVADSGEGTVRQIDAGSVAQEGAEVAAGIPNPYGLIEFGGMLYTSFSNNRIVGITEVGSEFAPESAFVRDFPVVITSEPFPELAGCGGSWGTAMAHDRLLLGHASLGTIFDVTEGGCYEDLRESRFAWGLNYPLGMTTDPLDGDLYVAEKGTGVIRRIGSDGGYARFSEPLVAGFSEPSCVRFSSDASVMFVCDRTWDAIYQVELTRN